MSRDLAEPAAVDGTWQADGVIEPSLKEEFLAAVRIHLKSSADKDHHPWADNQVVDLAHPSLHCYVEGVTQVASPEEGVEYTRKVGSRERLRAHSPSGEDVPLGDIGIYRWLPAEISLSPEGRASITSYVNNLASVRAASTTLLLKGFSRSLFRSSTASSRTP